MAAPIRSWQSTNCSRAVCLNVRNENITELFTFDKRRHFFQRVNLLPNMTTVYIRPNIKLAKLWYKYKEMDRGEIKPEQDSEKVKEEEIVEDQDYEAYPPINFSWLVENKIAAMGCPKTVANLNYLVDVGVNHLVTLSPERWPPILDCKKKLRWTEIRVKEYEAPTLKQIMQFIAICERAEIRGEVLGVHCRQGRGRTGTMLACYLVHFQNMAPERAVLTVRVQRPGSCETYEQEKAVCYYHDCLRGTIDKPDYRLVEDKVYFDHSMKYMFEEEDEEKINDIEEMKQAISILGDEDVDCNVYELEKQKDGHFEIIKHKRKNKPMVINHKIYF